MTSCDEDSNSSSSKRTFSSVDKSTGFRCLDLLGAVFTGAFAFKTSRQKETFPLTLFADGSDATAFSFVFIACLPPRDGETRWLSLLFGVRCADNGVWSAAKDNFYTDTYLQTYSRQRTWTMWARLGRCTMNFDRHWYWRKSRKTWSFIRLSDHCSERQNQTTRRSIHSLLAWCTNLYCAALVGHPCRFRLQTRIASGLFSTVVLSGRWTR